MKYQLIRLLLPGFKVHIRVQTEHKGSYYTYGLTRAIISTMLGNTYMSQPLNYW